MRSTGRSDATSSRTTPASGVVVIAAPDLDGNARAVQRGPETFFENGELAREQIDVECRTGDPGGSKRGCANQGMRHTVDIEQGGDTFQQIHSPRVSAQPLGVRPRRRCSISRSRASFRFKPLARTNCSRSSSPRERPSAILSFTDISRTRAEVFARRSRAIEDTT